ncbi:YajG family lipoprotein [Aliivibrio sp. S4TY2]|uniref:YajG family lipoprotein n=1 Tax=unclassified Aliivibrio TaxID=2645654 RepID=UPI00237930EB|nr:MULTISPECIES: YajG family lipoprotein [unclassified Aliivibrio]MDD9157089.1 YajG family lipoprotein [Aliivibrio sp. S4TY2]MDD9161078.1 YajG family lipoprotein [Aliivibrio sp. S4TY1]MDD9165001.1 YajG family lipoprotein [Aliivibrio sp. S4MY2]MDD9169106.1 YajG family lipoprotein [Aliivibrio sp. S4MY4]MDD9185834.1 YajG family lipoprotein [Aliivibrio sp. S4MY3]
MKKAIIAISALFLAACSAPSEPQLDIKPVASSNAHQIVENVKLTLDSSDLRTAQYVAVIDNGRQNVQPIHAKQNLRVTLEDALSTQLKNQGFIVTVDSDNTLRLDIIEALVSVQHSLLSNEMKTQVKLQITAETPRGKFVKTYNGVSEKAGSMSADNQDIEQVLNDLLNAVLDKIAVDEELQTYIKGNF